MYTTRHEAKLVRMRIRQLQTHPLPSKTMAQVATKVAVVSGGNKGIGLAIVRRLCKEFEGDVYLTARSEERGKEAVAKLQAEGLKPRFHQLDITSGDSVEALKQYMIQKYGGVDVLVNNAGMAYKMASTAPFIEQATNTLKTNFTGTLNISRAFLPIIRPHGRVVNVSSSAGHLKILHKNLQDKFSSPDLTEAELVSLMDQFVKDVTDGKHTEKGWPNTAYGTSKVGMTALTKVHAREMVKLGNEDILVNACCPGWVRTDMAGYNATLSPDEGAETPVHLAFLPPGSPSGEFWKNKTVVQW